MRGSINTKKPTARKRRTKNPIKEQELAQHTTPIAKTHRTATLFASEPTENLNLFINIHHRNITIPSPKHHRSITTHHWDPEGSPTQSRDITNITKTSQHNHYTSPRQARDITDTPLKDHQNITSTHAENILTHHQRITETSPRYHRIIHETQTKHNRDITETSPKHHQDITET